jgi:transcriptional regulator with XRE-family HTH domain
MARITVMRALRLEYGISTGELTRAARVSQQYLSGLELGEITATNNAKKLAQIAFDRAIEMRTTKNYSLLRAYSENRERLLDFVEDPL